MADLKLNHVKQSYSDFTSYLVREDFNGPVPSYKFFSSIITSLQRYRLKYGIDIRPAVREIRIAAQVDKKQNQKL